MKKERKHFTPEEKVAILRRHLVDKVPVSELCEELGLRPTVSYRWQKELFENGAAAFQSQERPHRQVEEKQKRIEFLEKKVRTKDEVLAELMAEHIALKKSLGGYVEHYNNVRLNSATGYITPKNVLAGRQQEIHAERDRKLEAARQQRQSRRQQAA
jgi:transposase-like protein